MQTQIRGEQIDIEDLATDIVTGSPAAAKDILATEFLLRDGTVNMTGDLDLDSNNIVNVAALTDGVRTIVDFIYDGAAVNYLEIENQATGGGPIIRVVGADTDIDLSLAAKGLGNITTNSDLHAASFAFTSDTTTNLSLSGPGVLNIKAGGFIGLTVDSTTVTLSQNLDCGANNITNVGTVDGRDVSADGTVLDGHTVELTLKVDKPAASAPPPGVGAIVLMDPTDPGNIADSIVAATGLGSPPGPPVLPLLPVLSKATLGPLGPGVATYPPGTLVFVPDAAPPGSPPSGPPEFVLAYVGDIFVGSPPAPTGPTWLRADTGLPLS